MLTLDPLPMPSPVLCWHIKYMGNLFPSNALAKRRVYLKVMFLVLMFFVNNIFHTTYGHISAAKTWRYHPVSHNTNGYFSTKTKFILEYIGNVNWDKNWYHDDDCHVENKTLPRSTALCYKPGYHPFGILNQSLIPMEVEAILVIETSYCYEWQMEPLPVNASSSEFNMKFQLWISKIGEEKDEKNSSSRSEFSRHISKMFYQIGQRPLVSVIFSHSNNEATVIRQEIYFAENNSVWEAKIMVRNLKLLKIKVDGPPTAFLDCFIKPMVFEYQFEKFRFGGSPGNIDQVSYGKEKSTLMIIQDDCAPSIIAVINDGHLILTQDYFVTSLHLTIPQNIVKNNLLSVHKAVFTCDGDLIINTAGVNVIISNSSHIYPVQGLPYEKLQFSSNSWCHQEEGPYHKTFSDNVVVAWNNQSSVYISLNETDGFTPLSLPNYVESQDFKLLDAKVNGMCHCVYFLVALSNCSEYNNSKVIAYVTYKYTGANRWGNLTKVLSDEHHSGNNSDWSFQFLPPNSFSMLIWNSWDIFYKNIEGEPAKTIIKRSNFSDYKHEHIIQVVTSNNGEYLVLYESNILYYGRIGMEYMVQLLSRFPEGTNMRMVFDLNGYARCVSVNKSNSLIVTTHYPLDSEIFNAVYPTFSCPFIEFSFGSLSSTNVLDKWGRFEIWGHLVYKRSESNDIQLNWNPSDILLLTVSERREFYNDVVILNKTFTFIERTPVNSSDSISPTSFSVCIIPKLNSMICKRPFHKVFHFHVGCPSSRTAIVRDARSIQSPPFDDEHSTSSLELVSGDVFQPVVLLYEHNVLIKQVNSSFEVSEVNGREDDFSLRDGQELGNTVEPPTVLFQGSGMFMFSLNFYDRNTSFCRTTLEISVLIKEEADADYFYIMFTCVTLITIVFINFLGVNYLLYRKSYLLRHGEDDDRRDRLQELQYLAQLQYYRANSGAVVEPQPVTEADSGEDVKRRTAIITGKSERRAHRRSSVFERVSKGVFEDLKVQRRSTSGESEITENTEG